jgi:hypothetical protein
VGVGFQPALAALLVLAQLALVVVGPVGLLGGHRQPTSYMDEVVVAAAQPAKHPSGLATGELLVGGQDLLRFLAVGGGPGQLPAAVVGRLVELAAQPVALAPQLRRRQPLYIQTAGGVDRQLLATGPGQGLGQLHIAVGLLPVRKIQLPGTLGFGPDHRVQAGLLAGPG